MLFLMAMENLSTVEISKLIIKELFSTTKFLDIPALILCKKNKIILLCFIFS